MKFKCKANNLQKGIGIVEKAVSTRSSLPVLENIFIEVLDNKLVLRGNDLEIGIQKTIDLETSEVGKVLVRAKTMGSIVSKLADSNVDISVDATNKLIIRSDKHADFDLLGTNSEEYPVFPEIESGIKLQIKIEQLRNLIKHTIYSVSLDETKQFLNGILIKNEQQKLVFVSTDGYRLSVKSTDIALPDQDFSAIVPFKAMNEIYKILQQYNADELVTINISANQVAFIFDTVVFVSRIIQGQFPDYKQVFPKEIKNSYELSLNALLTACERASIFAAESNNVIKLTFSPESVSIFSQAASLGEFKESIPLTPTAGEGELTISFNVRLLLDMLKNAESDDLQISFFNELSPSIFSIKSDDSFQYILMPIRVNQFENS